MRDWFVEVFGGGMFSGVYETLSEVLLGGEKYATATSFVKTIYENVMTPIAISLIVIWFVCAIIEKSTNEQFTYEQMFLLFGKMVVAIFLIDKGYELMMKFQELGIALLNDLQSTAGSLGMKVAEGGGFDYINKKENEPLQKLYESYVGVPWPDEPSFWDLLKNWGWLNLVIPWLFSFVVKVIIYVIVFMRILEIFIRTMFAPIALSDIFHSGLNSTGFRFMKSYLAVSLQIVVIYGVMLLFSVMTGDLAVDGDLFVIKYLGLMGAAVGILFKSQTLIKELVGAN